VGALALGLGGGFLVSDLTDPACADLTDPDLTLAYFSDITLGSFSETA